MGYIKKIAKKTKSIEFVLVFLIVFGLDLVFLLRYGLGVSLDYVVIVFFNIALIVSIITFIKTNKHRYRAYLSYLILIFVFFVVDSTLYFFKEDVTSITMLLESFRDTMRIGLKYNPLAPYGVFVWMGIIGVFSLSLIGLRSVVMNNTQQQQPLVVRSTSFLLFAVLGLLFSPQILDESEYLAFRNPADKILFVQEFGSSTYHKRDIADFAVNLVRPLFQDVEYEQYITAGFDGEVADKSPFFADFKNKNVIMIMCETCEQYAFSPEHTPNYYRLLDKGTYFDNFYSAAKSNYTYDAEFKSLTSMMYFQKDNYMYSFADNIFNNALPHVLSEHGYSVNAFHNFYRTFFNRDVIYYNMGFDNYYAPEELYLEEGATWPLDSVMFEQMKDLIAPVQENPFFSFIITVTPHGPHNEYREELREHYNLLALDESYDEAELELLTIKAAQMDFDKGLGILLDDLENKGLIKETIILLYSDHKNYSSYEITQKYTPNSEVQFETDKVPFIVYAYGITPGISTILSSHYDVTPTVLDLLGISYIQDYYYGQSVFLESRENRPIILGFTSWIGNDSIVFRKEILKGNDDFDDFMKRRLEIYHIINLYEKIFRDDFFNGRKTYVENS